MRVNLAGRNWGHMRLPSRTRKDDVDIESCLENLSRLAALDDARIISLVRPKEDVLVLTEPVGGAAREAQQHGLRAALAIELDAVGASLDQARAAANAAAADVVRLEAELMAMPAPDRRRADIQLRLGQARARYEAAQVEFAELEHHRAVLS